MAVLIIYGLPNMPREILEKFTDDLIDTTAYSVKGLGISRQRLSCFIIDRLSNEEQNDNMVISLEGLLDKPHRCAKRRNELAKNIIDLTIRYFPMLQGTQCIVEPFIPKKSFPDVPEVMESEKVLLNE